MKSEKPGNTWENLGNCGISCMRGCQGATQIANVLSFSSRRAAIKDIVSLTSSFIWFICHKYAISYHDTAPRLQSTPAFQHINFIQLQDFPKHLRYLEILKPEPDITRRCDKWLVQKWQCRWSLWLSWHWNPPLPPNSRHSSAASSCSQRLASSAAPEITRVTMAAMILKISQDISGILTMARLMSAPMMLSKRTS